MILHSIMPMPMTIIPSETSEEFSIIKNDHIKGVGSSRISKVHYDKRFNTFNRS